MEEMNRDYSVDSTSLEADGKWLTFRLDSQLYGVPVSYVEQILSMMPITEVPEYPYYSKGIINIRGAIVPVIDLRLRLGKAEAVYNDYTCIIICRLNDDLVGFIADAVDAVLTISPDCINDPPQIGEEQTTSYLTGIASVVSEDDGIEKLILCLDAVQALLCTDQCQSSMV